MNLMIAKRTKVAAAGTLAALACLTAVALAAGSGADRASAPQAGVRETVRTVVVHRTVGVLGDLFLDRYLDIDGSLTEPSLASE